MTKDDIMREAHFQLECIQSRIKCRMDELDGYEIAGRPGAIMRDAIDDIERAKQMLLLAKNIS